MKIPAILQIIMHVIMIIVFYFNIYRVHNFVPHPIKNVIISDLRKLSVSGIFTLCITRRSVYSETVWILV